MTDAEVQSPEEGELSVEELMILAAGQTSGKLPFLVEKVGGFVGEVGPILTEFVGRPVIAELETTGSVPIGEALAQLGESGTYLMSFCKEWDGELLIWCETALLGQLVDTLLGTGSEKEAGQERTFTRLEARIIRQLGAKVLAQFGSALSEVRELEFSVTGLEEPNSESHEWGDDKDCFVINLLISKEDTSGRLVMVLPFSTFDTDHEKLASEPEAPPENRSETWHLEMSETLSHTGVKLKAVLGSTQVPLSSALSWREGSTLTLGSGSSAEVQVFCGDHSVFKAVPGRRTSGALALRITSDVELERIAE